MNFPLSEPSVFCLPPGAAQLMRFAAPRAFTCLLVVMLMLVSSPLSAAEQPFKIQGGLRAIATVLSPRPTPESVLSQQWESQQNVYSLGVDLGVSKGPWALVGLATQGAVDYSCLTRHELLMANDPRGLELLHSDDCHGTKFRAGILGQHIVPLAGHWQGLVGTGIYWSHQTLQFTTEYPHQGNPTRSQTKLKSQGLELTVLDFEMRWKPGTLITIGPTSSFGWADDRFGSRFTASGGLRVGFE